MIPECVRLLIESVLDTEVLINHLENYVTIADRNPQSRIVAYVKKLKNTVLQYKHEVFLIDGPNYSQTDLLVMVKNKDSQLIDFNRVQTLVNKVSEKIAFPRYCEFHPDLRPQATSFFDRYTQETNTLNEETNTLNEGVIDSTSQSEQSSHKNNTADEVLIDAKSNITRVEYTQRLGNNFLETGNSSVCAVLAVSAEKQTNMSFKGFIGAKVKVNFNAPFTKESINCTPVQSLTLVRNKMQLSAMKLDYGGYHVNRIGIGYRPLGAGKNSFISINYPVTKNAFNIKSIGLEGSVSNSSLFQVEQVNCGATLKINLIKADPVFVESLHKLQKIFSGQAPSDSSASTTNFNAIQPSPLGSLSMRHIHFGSDFNDCFKSTSILSQRNQSQSQTCTVSIAEKPVYDFMKPSRNITFNTGAMLVGLGFLVTSFICSKFFKKS